MPRGGRVFTFSLFLVIEFQKVDNVKSNNSGKAQNLSLQLYHVLHPFAVLFHHAFSHMDRALLFLHWWPLKEI